MPPEHAGGRPAIGYEPANNGDNAARAVSITQFDYGCLDDLEAELAEAIALGQPIAPIAARLRQSIVTEIRVEFLDHLVALVLPHHNKELAFYALAFVGRLHVILDLSGSEIARKLGVSRQDFQQATKEWRRLLGLNSSPCTRSEEARERMRQTNHRNYKLQP